MQLTDEDRHWKKEKCLWLEEARRKKPSQCQMMNSIED